MTVLAQDARIGARMLTKELTLTLIACLILALATGANTTLFSMVNSFLFRPLDVKDPARLVVLAYQQQKGELHSSFSYPIFQEIQSQSKDVFTDTSASQITIDGLTVKNKVNRVVSAYVSGNYFAMLGLQPYNGRLLLDSEGRVAGSEPVAVLGYSFWKNHLDGDPSVVGTKALLNNRPVTIVGIAPEGFHGTYSILETQVYLPIGMTVWSTQPANFMDNRELRSFSLLSRLRPNVSLKQAQNLLHYIGERIGVENSKSDEGLSILLFPETSARPQPQLSNEVVGLSSMVLILAALVLVLACINVANIMLVRTLTRRHEMAIREALGASRARLIRQMLTESLLLALLGGSLGVLLGALFSRLIQSIPLYTDLPLLLDFSLDWRIFAYAFGIVLLTGLLVGILPALRASRTDINQTLREGGRGLAGQRHRVRNIIVVAQVAGSLSLLVVAGLFARTFQKAQHVDLGFIPDHLINLSVDPHGAGYGEKEGQEFFKQMLLAVRNRPGVQSASLASSVPMGYYFQSATLEGANFIAAPGQLRPSVLYNTVSPGYFETMGIAILKGRSFTEADDEKAKRVAIINQAMVDRYWPGEDPVGKTFTISSDRGRVLEIAGVARNSKFQLLGNDAAPLFFWPLAQNYSSYQTLQVRTALANDTVVPELFNTIRATAPDLPVFDVRTMKESLNTLNGLMAFRVAAGLTGSLGILGLILASVGTYGIVSNAVRQRSSEIGIRISLGAQAVDILRMIMKESFIVISLGLGVGLIGAWALGRFLRGFLVGVSSSDFTVFAGACAVLAAATLAACFLPARSALRVDPVIALRNQ